MDTTSTHRDDPETGVTDATEPLAIGPQLAPGRQFIERIPPNLVSALTVVGFTAPVTLYFWLIHTYALNVVVGDQFDDVTLIRGSYVHLFDWHQLWAQHNETRIFVPNLIVLASAHLDHFNIVHEEYLSASMLVTAIGLLIWSHKRRSPAVPWLYYCPVAFLLLSIVQWGNTLWGFQMAWYLTLLCIMAAICLIDRVVLTWPVAAVSMVVAVIGSLSLIQGFLIWPVGLFLLFHRRRLRFAPLWMVAAAMTALVYFRNFDTKLSAPYPNYAQTHLWTSAKFFVFAVGDVVGIQPPFTTGVSGYPLVLAFGIVTLVIAGLVVAMFGLRRDSDSGSPVGVALILVAGLFTLMVTKGRIIFGYWGAGASRYTTFNLLYLTGIYLSLLGRHPIRAGGSVNTPDVQYTATTEHASQARRSPRRVAVASVCVAVGLLIVIQSVSGICSGITHAPKSRALQQSSLAIQRNAAHESGSKLSSLYLFIHPPSWILERLNTLRAHHLTWYANGGNP